MSNLETFLQLTKIVLGIIYGLVLIKILLVLLNIQNAL